MVSEVHRWKYGWVELIGSSHEEWSTRGIVEISLQRMYQFVPMLASSVNPPFAPVLHQLGTEQLMADIMIPSSVACTIPWDHSLSIIY